MCKKYFILLLVLSSSWFVIAQTTTTVYYDSSGAIFPNPERGFSTHKSNAITVNYCTSLRNQNVTIIQRIYTVPAYNDEPFPQSFLDLVDSDLNAAREGGVKVVLRFSYTNAFQDEQHFGADAPLDIIMQHLNQLAPIFSTHYDVIAYVEAGFIGVWGEWYYSTNHLNNTTSRRAVLFKLLSVLPEDRCVAVRTPGYKKAIFNNTQPLTPDSAFSGSYRARTGAHNDCFLASSTDYGTYGNIESDKTYLNLDNRYVPQGGETCNPSAYSGCANALIDLNRMHWSVLNKDYHPTVLQGWINNGCMDEIKLRLGYRFRLLSATISDSVKPGGGFTLNFDIVNNGFASPYNPRNLEVVLRNTQSGEKYFLLAGDDPRFWQSGDTCRIDIEGGIPADMQQGHYDVMLHLADPTPALHDRPEYSIRLANENMWEDSTGYNLLQHDVIIDPSASGPAYTGDNYFQPGGISALEGARHIVPENYVSVKNYPNPFNGQATLEFELPQSARVKIDIMTIQGRLVEKIIDQFMAAGSHKIVWHPDNLSTGVYLYKLWVNENALSGRVVFLK